MSVRDTLDRKPGLADLTSLPLDAGSERALEFAASGSLGSPVWRARKRAAARSLVALAAIAPRMKLLALDMRTTLLALVELAMPVASLAPPASEITIHRRARLALRYPEEILIQPVPGHALVRIVEPDHVLHPNVGPPEGPIQALCLGASLPRGYPLVEAVLASYAALTLQAISLSELDPAGLMNAESVHWWNANRSRIPLSRDPFLAPVREVPDAGFEPAAGQRSAAECAAGPDACAAPDGRAEAEGEGGGGA